MWWLLSSYSIYSGGQNQVNMGVHLAGPAQGQLHEAEPPRVLAIREQRNEAQRLRIGEGRGENPKNSHKGVGWCEFRTRELGGANFAQVE